MRRLFGYVEIHPNPRSSRNHLRGVVAEVDEYNRTTSTLWTGEGRNFHNVSADVESVALNEIQFSNSRDMPLIYMREWRLLGWNGAPTRADLVLPRPVVESDIRANLRSPWMNMVAEPLWSRSQGVDLGDGLRARRYVDQEALHGAITESLERALSEQFTDNPDDPF